MNLYLLVEGRRTEKKVYPAWLSHIVPDLTRVAWAREAENNNYFLFSGNGYPALLHNHLKNSIDEVNELGNFDFLVLALDVDDSTVKGRIEEVHSFLQKHDLRLDRAGIVIIPQNRCIETWFLGNRKIFKHNPQDRVLSKYAKFFNVREDDPEEMELFPGFSSISQFHEDYCTKFLRERGIRYSKNRPNGVGDQDYFESLISRSEETGHLKSFKRLVDFLEQVRSTMQSSS